jgi:hypothetical protein
VLDSTLKVLFCPDLHAPYHHTRAWDCFLDVAQRWMPDVCIVLGDFGDFASVSSYVRDPRTALPLHDEVAGMNAELDRLDRALKRAQCRTKFYLHGNHEQRLSAYTQRLAPELWPYVSVDDMLKLDKRRWKSLPYKSSLGFGKLRVSHDVGRAGINAARQSVQDVGKSIVIGHTHRLQVSYQGNQTGERHVGATLGWLGDPERIDYRHRDLVRRDWSHGFGFARFDASGNFWLVPVPIIGGRCVVEGEIYGK